MNPTYSVYQITQNTFIGTEISFPPVATAQSDDTKPASSNSVTTDLEYRRLKENVDKAEADLKAYQLKMQMAQKTTSSLEGVDFENLKSVASQILKDPYYRSLVPASIYQPKYEQGPDFGLTVLPTSGQELKEYESKVREIVSHVKNKVEKELKRPVLVENLMKELSNNHDKFIGFIY